MLKRLMLLVLALLLVTMPLAMAEEEVPYQTRPETIILEGMEEEIVTTRFESPKGYALWYDPLIIQPREADEGNDIDDFMQPDAQDHLYQVSIHYSGGLDYSFEQAAQDTEQTMQENYEEYGKIEGTDLFQYPYRGFYGREAERTILNYVVDAGEGAFYVYVAYPTEAAEGFGDRVQQMLKSFEILG